MTTTTSMTRGQKVDCNCAHCGKGFVSYLNEVQKGRHKYCSRECSDTAKVQQVKCICEQCGNAFEASPHRVNKGDARFCSAECFHASRFNKLECKCLECGNVFYSYAYVVKVQGKGKYCSAKCATLAKRGEKSPLWRGGKKYYGENWYQQRKLVYERDGGVCQICRRKPRKGELEFAVHHIRKLRLFNGDYEAANALINLITLCPKCHKKAEYGKIATPVRLL